MDPRAAKFSIPAEKLVNTDNNNSIKSLSEGKQPRQRIRISKCLSEPYPVYYTDTLSESIIVECKDLRHSNKDKKEERQQPESMSDQLQNQFAAEVVSDTRIVKEVEQS